MTPSLLPSLPPEGEPGSPRVRPSVPVNPSLLPSLRRSPAVI